ncbi:MAG TPA: BadF/BadG/BcrA/BcrD ATPase family protein [Streptosporangiaceae bacterium]|nr:BadF/BadG/BcrA/BcrD ATPase family protein [Streptosporangiaceae bacterium]
MSRVLGLDIGATSTRARLVADGVIVGDAAAASASLTAVGRDRAAVVLDELLAGLPGLESPLDAVCAGAAGSRTARETSDFLRARLTPATRAGAVLVVDDASLVLPAAGLAEGVAVICGTGSIATGRWRDREAWAGGWGYLLGDEGSGYWIVRTAIRALHVRRASGLPPGDLDAGLLGAVGVPDLDALRAAFYRRPEPGHWARHAPLVLDSEDAGAEAIVRQAASHLADLAAQVAGQLEAAGAPVVLAGGLMASERLRTAAVAALSAVLLASPVRLLSEPPVAGAVRLAEAAAAR